MKVRTRINHMLERWGDSSRVGPAGGRDLGRSLGARC